MKKLFLPLAFVCLFTSCKKEDVIVSKQKPEEIAFNWKNKDISTTITSEPYNQTIFDSCINDSIALSGLETYKLSQFYDSTASYIRYEIDLTGITGIGQNTGLKYEGGGKIVGITIQNYDGSTYINKVTMRIVYKSKVDKIVFKQLLRFIQRDNIIKVQFDTGYLESCKLNK